MGSISRGLEIERGLYMWNVLVLMLRISQRSYINVLHVEKCTNVPH